MAAARRGKAHGLMASSKNAPEAPDAPKAIEAELLARLVASAAGLPRVCLRKRCRRAKRCLAPVAGGGLPCMRHHNGLANARFRSALKVLGWPNRDERRR
jgi:hypothetical protein